MYTFQMRSANIINYLYLDKTTFNSNTITIPALGDGVDDLGDAVVRAECDGDQQQVAAQFFEIFFSYQIFVVTKQLYLRRKSRSPTHSPARRWWNTLCMGLQRSSCDKIQ